MRSIRKTVIFRGKTIVLDHKSLTDERGRVKSVVIEEITSGRFSPSSRKHQSIRRCQKWPEPSSRGWILPSRKMDFEGATAGPHLPLPFLHQHWRRWSWPTNKFRVSDNTMASRWPMPWILNPREAAQVTLTGSPSSAAPACQSFNPSDVPNAQAA